MLAALGCAGPPAGPTIDLQEERSALMKADKAWFDSHENIDKFLTFMTDDATFMPDGAPLARGDSIRTTWEYLLSLPGFNLEWQATGAKVSKGGNMGYTIGTYELTAEQDGVSMVTVGKYVTLWEKQADRSWRVAVDCFNSDGPSTGE
jgi:ketosteroid isomerase-like protein